MPSSSSTIVLNPIHIAGVPMPSANTLALCGLYDASTIRKIGFVTSVFAKYGGTRDGMAQLPSPPLFLAGRARGFAGRRMRAIASVAIDRERPGAPARARARREVVRAQRAPP